jgi:Flp pilus assembly protein protease CpaA
MGRSKFVMAAAMAFVASSSIFGMMVPNMIIVNNYFRYWNIACLPAPGNAAGDPFNLIFPVYLKLMTGFPSFQAEDVGGGDKPKKPAGL